MKNIKLILTFTAALVFTACSEDYLVAEPTEVVSSGQIADIVDLKPEALNSLLSGIYTTMYTAGSGGTDLDHDDFGQKGYDIYTDMISSDMVLAGLNYGWYTRIVNYQTTVNFTDINNYKPWRYYYRIILSSNQIIAAFGGNDFIPESAEAKHIMGQAKALRAYAYFYLAQLYQKEYSADELILPIYTDTKAPNQPKSSAADVYALIIKDLTDSETLLSTFNRENKSSINQSVAQGLLAYAYGAQGNYQKVLEVTNKIIAKNEFPLTTASQLVGKVDSKGKLINADSGFNNVATPSWMWGVDLTVANDLDLVSWWGQVDRYTYSYAWAGDPKTMDKKLQDQIKSTDIRKEQFTSSGRPSFKFFDPNRVIGGQRTVTTDYIYMRIEEMYLLNAEAQAKLGNDSDARTTLKTLLTIRNVDGVYLNSMSGTTLQKEIYLQTRIEFWGEGKSYLAMKRNKATVTRGSNHLYFAGESFQYNDDKLTFDIPQAEILNNPFIN